MFATCLNCLLLTTHCYLLLLTTYYASLTTHCSLSLLTTHLLLTAPPPRTGHRVAQVLLAALVHPCYRDRSFDLRAKPVGDPSTSATVRLGDFVELCGTLGERNCDYSLGKIA